MKRLFSVTPAVLALALSSALPALATPEQPTTPPELAVPDGYNRVLESVGRGVQIYDCTDGAWKFREPAAAIFDQGRDEPVAIHNAGPTWQSIGDGSEVVGAVKARHDGPNPEQEIPWLLLEATSTSGPGVFAPVQYIQRLDTTGGVAPDGACTTGQSVSVPYTATYAFWAPAQ